MVIMKRLFLIVALVTLLILVDFSTAQGNSLPDSAYITGLTGHPQSYSLSCEARSAVDLATFWGLNIGETEFLQALPRTDDPETGYVGDPNAAWGNIPPHGYGVHATPVAELLQAYGMEAIGLNDLSWEDLRWQINAGHPVIVWIIGAMWDGTPVDYEASDGSHAIVAAFEHTMILTGYDQDSVQVVDAYSGQYQTYPLNMFIKSWDVLGNMAVFASRKASDQNAAHAETHSESYTVQPGDYIIALAKRFGLSWLELAELNSIGFPYIIHPGQVLNLPARAEQVAEPAPEPAPESVPEPVVNEPAPANKVVIFNVRLPLVHREYVTKIATPMISAPRSPEPSLPAVSMSSTILSHFGESMRVDWQLLVRLKELILPYLIHTGELLKLK
jgi:uncharacterized protein YvpB/LysM repeat protein